jgi:hypothetical protein
MFVLTLTVVVSIFWKHQKKSERALDSNAITSANIARSKLVIHSANYRAKKSGGTTYDVADFLRGIIKGDSLVLDPILNHSFSLDGKNYVATDPYFGETKRLQVTYSFGNEQPKTVTRYEYGRLVLPQDTETERLEKELSATWGRYSLEKENDLNEKAGLANLITQLETELAELKKPGTSLRRRILTLHNDIVAFLLAKGCKATMETNAEPPRDPFGANIVEMPVLESVSVADHAILTGTKFNSSKQQTMDAIHFGFERQFKARVSDLILELREHGIRDYELEQSENGGSMRRYFCGSIRQVAERLIVLWSKTAS